MRAVFLESIPSSREFEITDKRIIHHLLNVLRIQAQEKLTFFDGTGVYWLGEVIAIKKKIIQCKLDEKRIYSPGHSISLGLSWLKKEALESALSTAVQLGVEKIYLFKGDFSQSADFYNEKRVRKILISSMEQSNHFKFPQILFFKSLKELYEKERESMSFIAFSPSGKPWGEGCIVDKRNIIYLVGPEGGFSLGELSYLKKEGVKFFQMPVPILRAPIAVSCAMGYILGKSKR